MELFISLTINGLMMGTIYAIIAMGLVLLIRAVGIMNFAQGDLLAVGAFLGYTLFVQMELPLWAAIIVSLVCYAVFALIFMFCVYYPQRNNANQIPVVIATIGASTVIREGLSIIYGTDPKPMPYFITDDMGQGVMVSILGVNVQLQYILTIGVGVFVILIVTLFIDKLYVGKMIQATSQSRYTAALLGVPTTMTIALTYILSCSIASFSGFLVAPMFSVKTSLSSFQFAAFSGAVIGGWGSTKGAIIGAMMVGLIQAYATPTFSIYKDAVVFGLFLLFLLFKPQGLFPSKIGEKA